ncbi:neuropeptide FF receptor 1 like 2 [Amphiprion ocellaris]|uniref:neuropeptide FF receptor 1 like 2 n=1 Tax=Amphiprion ocellaris TaxID=80972 RepID=UPI002410D32E|nr:neuropeptide FF receptor 1 like 2 [Amphiprion ocellaris]
MEILGSIGEEGMALEGSAISAAILNTSLDSALNVTNITFYPYYQHSLYVAASYILAYSFIFLLCMMGNILVCLIVLENRRMRTVTNLFIFNLAISDLLVGIFCIPTTLVDNLITGWPFSNTVCKMSGFVQGVSVSASVFTLVAIAVERFRCIVYPLQPKLTLLVAKTAIVSIWVLAVVIMCPTAVALTVEKVPFHYMVYNDDFNQTMPLYSCYENFANPKMGKIYTAVLLTHIYLVPLTVITVMYGSIGVKLCSSVVTNREPQANDTVQARGRRRGQPMISQKKIRVIKMLIVVALLFMLSWLPLWTLLMMADYADLDREQIDFLTSYVFPFAHWLAFSNSSVNPIIYGYYNENFRRGFQAVCKSRPFCCLMQCQLWSRVAKWRKSGRPMRPPSDGGDFRDAMNHNHSVWGLRNRVCNDNKLRDAEETNRSARVGCGEVHAGSRLSDQGLEMAVVCKKSHDREKEKVRSMAVSVYQAWDN